MSHQVLAGDIGGTNARLAVVEVGGAVGTRIVHQARYRSPAALGLASRVTRFLGESGARPAVACFGIACPVLDGDCEALNLAWTVNRQALAREIGIPRTASKGRLSDVVARMPVSVILTDDVALCGAAAVAARMLTSAALSEAKGT